jgi:hypothetical protein
VKKPRFAHVVPAYRRSVDIDVALGVARDAGYCVDAGFEHAAFYTDCNNIARARNLAVETAFNVGADFLMMQDSDVFVQVTDVSMAKSPSKFCSGIELLLQTMKATGAAAVGAAVVVRNGNRMNCEPALPGEYYSGDVGTGLMLIDLNRLAKLERPWFVHADKPSGLEVECGEDIYFCRKIRAAGFDVVVDYTFPTGHTSVLPDVTRVAETSRIIS